MNTQIEEEKPQQEKQPSQVQKVFEDDDDDFEEFEQEDLENVHGDDRKIDVKQWREDWDDEDLNDEFAVQLKKELEQQQ